MTRTSLIMQIAVWITVCSTIFGMATDVSMPDQTVVDPDPVSGTQSELEMSNETDEGSGFLFHSINAGICIYGGLLLAGDNCELTAKKVFGFSDITSSFITVVSGINEFTDGLKTFLTFNVPGAPSWFRAMVSVPLNLGLLYIIIATARGV